MKSCSRWMLIAGAFLCCGSYAPVAAAHSTLPGCGSRAGQLRETLEAVVEAAIDHQPARSAPAARRAVTWWKLHRRAFAEPSAGDSAIVALATARGTIACARAAVVAATASFAWCDAPPQMADRLMQLDLVGMTAWLRAQGAPLPSPPFASDAVTAVTTALQAHGASSLATRVQQAVARAQAPGDSRAAQTLLDLVDDAEKVLR